jgi:hypothetical protein
MKKKLILLLLFVPFALYGQNPNIHFVETAGGVMAKRGTENVFIETPSEYVEEFGLSLFNQTKIYNVLDYGAVGDSITNDTDAIQACIDDAQNGTVYIPSGKYSVTSTLEINYATQIKGAGTMFFYGDNGTVIFGHGEFPIFHIDTCATRETNYGASIQDLLIFGSGDAYQTGINITTEGTVLIKNVRIGLCGDYAIRLGGDWHTTGVEISNCDLQQNAVGGIYGRIQDAGYQITAIRILNNMIQHNTGYGINLIGTNITIRGNIIQGNDSSGIYLGARDMNNDNCSSTNTLIDANWIEGNYGGEVYIGTYYDDSPVVYQTHTGIEISNNTFITNLANITNPRVVACIQVHRESGSVVAPTVYGLKVRSNNYFSAVGGAVWFDGDESGYTNSLFDYSTEIEFGYITAPFQAYTHLGRATIIDNRLLTGALTDGAPTDAQIDAVIGVTPAVAGIGYSCRIFDTNGTGLTYLVRSDGTNWIYTALAKAL